MSRGEGRWAEEKGNEFVPFDNVLLCLNLKKLGPRPLRSRV